MDWVENSEQADNTYVVFLSDNGFLFGEHGLIDKRNAFEESMRIPLIIWGPGITRRGESEQASVSMLNIAPTLIDLAGGTARTPLEGRSLVPFLQWKHDCLE